MSYKFKELPIEERIKLVEDLWDSIAADQKAIQLTDAQKEELERRLNAYHVDCPSPGLLDTEIRDYNYLRRCTRTWEERGENSVRSLKEKRLH